MSNEVHNIVYFFLAGPSFAEEMATPKAESVEALPQKPAESRPEVETGKSIPDKIDQYYEDNHGIGFGPISGAGLGLLLFYDLNLHGSWRSQLHFRISSSTDSESNFFGTEIVSMAQTNIGAVYRKLFRPGFYIGAGLSLFSSTVKYTDPSPDDINSKYNS